MIGSGSPAGVAAAEGTAVVSGKGAPGAEAGTEVEGSSCSLAQLLVLLPDKCVSELLANSVIIKEKSIINNGKNLIERK